MQALREVIDECGFIDLGFVGSEFTWHKHFVGYTVRERLDRAVATSDWLSLFSDTKIYHLEADASDHRPILIVPDGMDCSQQRPFRFEQMWLTEQGCTDTVQAVWQRDSGENEAFKVIRKVDECGKELTKWSKNNFRNVRKELEKTRKLLAKAELIAMNGGNNKRMKYLEKQILTLRDREAKMWAQRSKVQWLRDGDKKHPLLPYEPVDFEGILEQIPTKVTEDMNGELLKEFTSEEVEMALKQMAPLKSPGPDGMPQLFYQSYWSLVGPDVTEAILWLKKLMPQLISDHQSAFMADRLISDNIMVAFETLHYMRNHSSGNIGYMALKLDMSKAYDRVEWLYMEKLMRKMGFAEAWVKLMMMCISTGTYSGWEGKLLSQAGREILIKAVAQALPTYAMSCFKLPRGLCHDIEALVKKFFWGQRGEGRKIHWTKWEELCKPKTQGGMGFKDLSRFNDALLAKQTWRLLHDKTSLFYRVFKARYFPNCTIMEAKSPSSASYAWKSIIKGREVIQKGAVWRIGDGRSVPIWGTRWLPAKHSPKIISPCTEALAGAKVCFFMDADNKSWKADVLDENLLSFEADMIKKIPLSHTDQADTLTWPFTPNGEYTVKSGYTFLQQEYQSA
nr:uncharacterized protein LOC112004916 [Quercus suber]